ncbi:MAG: hypothetical protein COC15_04610 [Legionellales bacterium]|nr:MAG: hypothetical protein COC15_04610 [Legionellales bacterium]
MKYLIAIILPILIILGVWQINRGLEKQANTQQFNNSPPVTITGTAFKTQFLLDNQIYNKQVGYYILTPILTKKNVIILINRGWVAANNRKSIPNIQISAQPQNFQGIIKTPGTGIVLQHTVEQLNANIVRIQSVDFLVIAKQLDNKIAISPSVLHLDKSHPEILQYITPYLGMKASKHFAYAAQWFAMALAIIVYLVVLLRP